jgi:hypothetical protein
MNLVTIIENIEIERSNNKQLGDSVEKRLHSLQAQTLALLDAARAFVRELEHQQQAIEKALPITRQEFEDRDTALANLIGGA